LYRTRVGQEVGPRADEREEGPIYLPIVKELKIAGSINGYKKQLTHCTRFDPYLLSFA